MSAYEDMTPAARTAYALGVMSALAARLNAALERRDAQIIVTGKLESGRTFRVRVADEAERAASDGGDAEFSDGLVSAAVDAKNVVGRVWLRYMQSEDFDDEYSPREQFQSIRDDIYVQAADEADRHLMGGVVARLPRAFFDEGAAFVRSLTYGAVDIDPEEVEATVMALDDEDDDARAREEEEIPSRLAALDRLAAFVEVAR
jgi:hypothetical protein